jgi:hypothetical protein
MARAPSVRFRSESSVDLGTRHHRRGHCARPRRTVHSHRHLLSPSTVAPVARTVPEPVLTVRLDGSVEYETSDGEVRHVQAGRLGTQLFSCFGAGGSDSSSLVDRSGPMANEFWLNDRQWAMMPHHIKGWSDQHRRTTETLSSICANLVISHVQERPKDRDKRRIICRICPVSIPYLGSI